MHHHSTDPDANQGNGTKSEKLVFEVITAADLAHNNYAVEFLIDGVMTSGQPMIVAGGKKQLKTNILIDLGLSLATQTDFLGEFKVNRPVKVGIMSGESGIGTIAETCKRICISKNLHLEDIGNIIFSPDLPRMGSIKHTIALVEFIKYGAVEVLILDPAYMMMPGGDASNLFIQGQLLGALAKTCQDRGVTLALCHHTKKGTQDPYSPPELEDIAWAGFQEFARQWFLLGRRERYEPGSGLHRLWLNIGGSAGHSDLWGLDIDEGKFRTGHPRKWEVSFTKASEARDDAKKAKVLEKDAKRVQQLEVDLGVLKQNLALFKDGVSKTALGEYCGFNATRFGPILAEAIDRGIVEHCQITTGNHKSYKAGYRTAECTDDAA